jgi:hypothetical protein
MTKTVQQLVVRTLQELKIISGTETPSAEDAQQIRDDYAASLQSLEFLQAAAWTEDAIPDPYFLPLARYMAAVEAPLFGVKYATMGEAEMALRRVTAQPYTGAEAMLNYL